MYINSFFKNIFVYLFVWLRRVFVVRGTRDLLLWHAGTSALTPGIKPGPPALGAQS